MIEIPTADIVKKIQDQKGLSEGEIREKINEKLKQLSGLISEQGAAHIIANELGVQLLAEEGAAKISDLYAGMRNVSLPGKVTRKFEVRTFTKDGREGKVGSFFLGDETGQIRVTLWNDQTAHFDTFKEGDTLRVSNAYVKENRGYKELHLNSDAKIEVNPEGVHVKEFQGVPRAQRERKAIKELTGDEENIEILGTIVQLYDPRFFDVCPECNKRVTSDGDTTVCAEHGEVTPQTNYVLSAFLDDGTGTIRATFWRQQSQRLLEKSDAEILAYKENPAAFADVKTEMLGEIIKVVGRCKKNEALDRIELTAGLVFRNIDPEEELERLRKESEAQVDKLDAPQELKEQIKETLEPPPHAAKVEVTEDVVEEEITNEAEEEAISLDDLDDLEETL
ncbi:hypothetical protein D6789_01175 [Candidatus Woesearchaeota archaeon]|nr:MAG: hypothetical protein D6789_01175 [Candidatus Woesearchaeota archaeon]